MAASKATAAKTTVEPVHGVLPGIAGDLVPIESLVPWPGNPRKHALPIVVESLRENGQYKPITARRSDRRILAGHGTVLAAWELSWTHVQVSWVDCDDQTALRIVAVDNKASDHASYDDEKLAELLSQLESLAGSGFSQDELDALLAQSVPRPSLTDPDDAPAVPKAPRSKLGDVWLLGPHRVVCGSSTDLELVSGMLGGERCDGMWTDPPYGVSYVGGTKDKLTIANDGAEGLPELLAGAFSVATAALRPGVAFYVAHADTARIVFEQAMIAAGWQVRQNLIWVKNALVLGRSDYHYRHEPILAGEMPAEEVGGEPLEVGHEPVLYGFSPGGIGRLGRGGQRWHGDNRQTTVFEVPKPPRNAEHPTMKPVALITAMLGNSVRPGGLVYEPFGGSGSTLIACHTLGLAARVVELDPRYVDVICRRYQEHTGVVPVRASSGEPVDFTVD